MGKEVVLVIPWLASITHTHTHTLSKATVSFSQLAESLAVIWLNILAGC